MNVKTCNRCDTTLPLGDFYVRPRCRDGYSNQCKRCEGVRQKGYSQRPDVRERRNAAARGRSRPAEQIRRQRLWTWHRLTPEQYDAILATQGGRCAICRSADPGGRGEFHVDHDHACCPTPRSCGECVRGLLCSRCNPMLGMAKDSIDVLKAAVTYLEG